MINKFEKNTANLYNNVARRALKRYYDSEPVCYSRLSTMIGITETTLREFVAGADVPNQLVTKILQFLRNRQQY